MARLARLWVATLTNKKEGSGTRSPVRLRIFAGDQLRLAHTLKPESDKDFEEGRNGLFEIDLRNTGIRTEELDEDSFRFDVLGNDEWRPAMIVVWGEVDGGFIVPLAIDEGMTVTISLDPFDDPAATGQQAQRSLTLPRISLAERPAQVRIMRCLVMFRTDPADDSGTEERIELQVNYKNSPDHQNIPEDPLGKGKALMAFTLAPIVLPGSSGRTRNRSTLESIMLRTKSPDKWLPSSFLCLWRVQSSLCAAGLIDSARPHPSVAIRCAQHRFSGRKRHGSAAYRPHPGFPNR